jgi:hypothetical protein
VEDDIDELSPQAAVKVSTISKTARTRTQVDDDERDPLSDPVEPDVAEEVDDADAARILSKTRSKRKSIDPTPTPLHEEDDTEDLFIPETKRRRREITAPNRVKQRQPKVTASSKAKTSKRPSSGKRARAGSPIPVVVHRLTEGLIYEGDDPDIDILNAEIPNVKRAGVNAIDTLRQVCEESFGRALETLQEGRNNSEDNATRREYMTKYRAIDSFAGEVYARLVEHVSHLLIPTYAMLIVNVIDYQPGQLACAAKTSIGRKEKTADTKTIHSPDKI